MSAIITTTPNSTESDKSQKTIFIKGESAAELDGAKIILNGKLITAEELGKVDSSQIDNIVADNCSGENVIRVTTKHIAPTDYSQLENAEVCVNGKKVKASSLKTLDQRCITDVNIDKRGDKTSVDIRTKDGRRLKKQKSKKR